MQAAMVEEFEFFLFSPSHFSPVFFILLFFVVAIPPILLRVRLHGCPRVRRQAPGYVQLK